jgi:UDP-3-O-[3-hydroxymyristoyl] glucosamine N-acyltransferase
MELTAATVSQLVNGQLEGDPSIRVHTITGLDKGTPGALSFFYDPKYEEHLYHTTCAVVIIPDDFSPKQTISATLIRVPNPYQAFNQILTTYAQSRLAPFRRELPHFIADSAQVADDVYIGYNVYIAPRAVIRSGVRLYPGVYVGEGVVIGPDTTLYPYVTIYADCVIGARCVIHAHAVIGSDGFGFIEGQESTGQAFVKVPQIGNVIIEDDVEIGASTCVDRSTLGSTRIGQGAKLDNLIQIGHNVEIGSGTGIAAQSGIAGGVKVGPRCKIGGQVGIVGHLSLGEGTQVGARSGISKSTHPGEVLRGAPAHPIREQLRMEAALRQLPDLLRRVQELERKLQDGRTSTDNA